MIRGASTEVRDSVDQIIERLQRMLRLDNTVFTEIANDESAIGPAIGVAAVASAIAGITGEGNLAGRVIGGAIGAVIGLFIWTAIIYGMSKAFGGKAEYGQLVRPLGFSSAPYALAIIPVLGAIVGAVWSLILQIRAVREVNEVGDGTAIAIVLIPFAILFVLGIILAVVAGLALLSLMGGTG